MGIIWGNSLVSVYKKYRNQCSQYILTLIQYIHHAVLSEQYLTPYSNDRQIVQCVLTPCHLHLVFDDRCCFDYELHYLSILPPSGQWDIWSHAIVLGTVEWYVCYRPSPGECCTCRLLYLYVAVFVCRFSSQRSRLGCKCWLWVNKWNEINKWKWIECLTLKDLRKIIFTQCVKRH